MKMRRIELLISDAEMKRIERETASLGVSPSEYVSQAAALLDAEDMKAARELPSLLPEFNAALDRIHGTLVAAAERSEKHRQEMARMRTPEYREEVRRSIEKDLAGLDAVASLFGGAPAKGSTSELQPPVDAIVGERATEAGAAGTSVREARQTWKEENSERKKKPSQ
ncbi:MAG TPA: hypothetical protein VF782_04610 [Allosphingosinicella sp.]|jgi:hypothetical protein